MKTDSLILSLAAANLAQAVFNVQSTQANPQEVDEAFVSFSIELYFFPDYAGTSSSPNTFSNNLLENIGNIAGTKPYIRVGGNTQDYALYDASQTTATKGVFDDKVSTDYPTTVTLGPSFFDSYGAFSDTKFSHGFNMEAAGTGAGWQTLTNTVPLACKALSGKLYYWEYGNEPNLFPAGLSNTAYLQAYQNGTAEIMALVKEHCPDLASSSELGFFAPSLSSAGTSLDPATIFADGLNKNGDIKLFSTHNYIAGAETPGVTLAGTLLNHGTTVQSVQAHVTEYKAIANPPPMIFGECNSLYNEGTPGLSNTFGAALWGVDFNLYSASVGFKRTHMHQGTDYRYAAWQPVTTSKTAKGTKAPYYGNIAVASMLGDLVKQPASIANIDLGDNQASAYAAYIDGGKTLARLMVINMNPFNSTVDGQGVVPLSPTALKNRPSAKYSFAIGGVTAGKKISMQQLMASGSDAITGVTWDGYSFNYELNEGKPARLNNVTNSMTVTAGSGGVVNLEVPDSSAVMLDFIKSASSVTTNGLPDGAGQGTASASASSSASAGRRGKNILFWEF